ncbi:LysR family transcriptional regulator, partial [Acinetobacter baumannii]
GALCISNLCATKPQKCEFACDKETGHEYTIRTLVEQHNIAEAYTLKT